ncbi:MAG: hypothetical protein ABR907_10190 [Terracidiphilus sp.]|jgi:hypothetical protein
MHSPHEGKDPGRELGDAPHVIDASAGYEKTDVGVAGIVVFLASLAIFAVVTAALAYGIGKVINAHMAKEDGPPSKWARSVDVRPLGDLASSAAMQNKMAEMTQKFPTPRVQTDDGNQDVADLHAREDLLLENYSWADQGQGKVRIPIERAMELLAQRGLPVATAAAQSQLMTGETKPEIVAPLTNGFARTSYELDRDAQQAAESGRMEQHK